MSDVFGSAMFWAMLWALWGGAGYAGTRLSTALWGGREVTARARRLALAQFGLALMLAPAAGYVLTPWVMAWFPAATLPATAFLIGLVFNAVWPLLVEPQFLRTLIADLARGLASRLSTGDTR